jgi:hypothetical protein
MRAALFASFFLLAGCAAEPVPYHSGNEIPRGPGLLTGTQGEFVLSAEEYRQYREWRERNRTVDE